MKSVEYITPAVQLNNITPTLCLVRDISNIPVQYTNKPPTYTRRALKNYYYYYYKIVRNSFNNLPKSNNKFLNNIRIAGTRKRIHRHSPTSKSNSLFVQISTFTTSDSLKIGQNIQAQLKTKLSLFQQLF